jgi:hypothetical protein
MEKRNINPKANLNIEVNCPCPNCQKGHLIPFLKAVNKNGNNYSEETELDHYEIYYRCSNVKCYYQVEG